jgi:hypothetical protein
VTVVSLGKAVFGVDYERCYRAAQRSGPIEPGAPAHVAARNGPSKSIAFLRPPEDSEVFEMAASDKLFVKPQPYFSSRSVDMESMTMGT